MPAITSGKVLVTGANGFIAGWITKILLEHGFSVRGTVRALSKAEVLRQVLAEYADRLEFVVVADITLDGAFDEAVKGVDALVHVASPVHLNARDPEEIIRPAVDGTTSVLRSASLPSANVKRIVFVSSLAAVVNGTPGEVAFTEADWNETDPAEVKEKGPNAHPAAKYRTSKTLAERAAWDFYRQGKEEGSIAWDLVSLCPPWTFGPILDATKEDQLNTSIGQWYTLCVKEEGELPTWSKGLSWNDVRDFAAASLAALTKPQAGGERFIISAGPFAWQQWVALARRLLNKPTSGDVDPFQDDLRLVFDAQKSRDILGVRYHSMEETAAFMIEDFRARGWC